MILSFNVKSNKSTRCPDTPVCRPDVADILSGCFRYSRPDEPVYALVTLELILYNIGKSGGLCAVALGVMK